MGSMSLNISFNNVHITTISVDAELGKINFKHLHEDSVYLSNPQFRIFKRKEQWLIEHCSSAKNETVVDGRKLVDAVPIRDGMVVTVGNSAKNILKLPLSIKLINSSTIPESEVEISLEYTLKTESVVTTAESFGMKETCDFCCRKVLLSNATRLKDRRVRCLVCSERAIDTTAAADKICQAALKHMRERFSLSKFKQNISIEFIGADALAKKNGSDFVATEEYDVRSIGLAHYEYSRSVFGTKSRKYGVFIEHGFPPEETMMTMVHELTHIWQYENLDCEGLKQAHGGILSEGHPCLAEVEIARWLKCRAHSILEQNLWEDAVKSRIRSLERDASEYGRGYRLLVEMMGTDTNCFQFMRNRYGKS